MQTLSLRVGEDEAHGLDNQDPVSSQRCAMLIMVLTGAALPAMKLISFAFLSLSFKRDAYHP